MRLRVVCWARTFSFKLAKVVELVRVHWVLWSFLFQPRWTRTDWNGQLIILLLNTIEFTYEWFFHSLLITCNTTFRDLNCVEFWQEKKCVAELLSALLPLGWLFKSINSRYRALVSVLAELEGLPAFQWRLCGYLTLNMLALPRVLNDRSQPWGITMYSDSLSSALVIERIGSACSYLFTFLCLANLRYETLTTSTAKQVITHGIKSMVT